jgi:chemotaxis signal transduction protein
MSVDRYCTEGHAPQQEKAVGELQQFIGIRLVKELYGIPLEKIREVTKPLQITCIPGVSPHIIGLMNLHGEILCVVDTKILLNIGKTNSSEYNRIIIVKTGEGPVGILCDEVTEIYEIQRKGIEPPLSTISTEIGKYLSGQVQTHDGLMGILDIEGLLFKQEK